MLDIFTPSLVEIGALMKIQLIKAKQRQIDIDKMVLVGGFAGSPALRLYLKSQLNEFNVNHDTRTRLIASQR